jgi:hypothetical protein
MCDPTMISTGDRALRRRNIPSYHYWAWVAWARQQIGLVLQLATRLRVAPTPRLEAPRDCVEQPGFVARLLLKGGPAEETRPQLGIPADVVPWTHLVLEQSHQQQTLCPRGFHHQPVVHQRRVNHKMVEDRAEICGSRQIDVGLRRCLSVVRQQAGVVEQLLSVDGGLGEVLKAQNEKLQRLPMIDREQLS